MEYAERSGAVGRALDWGSKGSPPAESLYLLLSSSSKIVSEYDQKIPQSQTADNPVASGGRAAHPSRDTMRTN